MKILIHGRKNGYTVLYPKPTPIEFYSFASDIQSISANNYDVYYGKCFYTLVFVDGGCVFTEYVIGEDVERGQLGEIGISVFIPNTQKLSGADVKTLLDKLIDIYIRKYISNNKIDEPKNGFNWPEFSSFSDSYDAKLQPRSTNNDNVTTGTQDPAFHYYKSDSELIEHLDKPFQEEYNDFRQILFIDSNLQGAANPINVIKNSGIEVNPDLKDEPFYLNNYNSTRGVKITANYKPRSDGRGNNQIRAKWKVEIEYSKDDRCYEPINASGTISELSSDIHKYLDIKGNQIIIKYDAFNNPIPIIKQVYFEIKNQNGKSIEEAEIQIDTRPWVKVNESATTINFQGEEIIRQWQISAKKESENLYSDQIPVTPDNQNRPVILTLRKQKTIEIFAFDEANNNKISSFNVECDGGKIYRENVTKIIFVNDEINTQWDIKVSKKDGRDTYSGKFKDYSPATGENPLKIPCKKNMEVSIEYKIDAGEHGKTTNFCPHYSTSRTGNDLAKNCIIANKGYVFTGWGFNNNTLVAQYIKRPYFYQNPKFIIGIIVGVFVIGIGILALHYYLTKDIQQEETLLTAQQITAYVEGDSLFIETLIEYKQNWKLQEQNFIIKSGGGIFGGAVSVDSSNWKNDWKPAFDNIERAVTKRNLTNNKNFAELKSLRYSTVQQIFKAAIGKIDSTKYSELQNNLGDVSTLTLTQIADSINAILTSKEQEKQEQPQEPNKENQQHTRLEHPKEQPKQQEQNPATRPTQQIPATTDNTSKIIQYIIGSELDEAKLIEYKNERGINQNLKNSIQLCLDFWELDGSGSGKKSKTYWSFQKKLNADKNFNNSRLKAFIEKMCQEESPSYSKRDKKRGLKES